MNKTYVKQLFPMDEGEKQEVLLDALHKTIDNINYEYEFTCIQVVGALEIIKHEFVDKYEKSD